MSTTVIDALLVTLGLDASNFSKGADAVDKGQKKISAQAGASAKAIEQQEKKLADAQKKRAQELEARSKQIAMGLSKIRNEALGLLSLFTAGMGLKNFAVSTITTGANMGRLSDNLGMATERLAAWQLANKDTGGTAEGMTAQLKESADEIARMQTWGGFSEAQRAFMFYDGNPEAFKDANTYLEARADILDRIYNKEKNPALAALAAKQMNIGDDSFDLLKQGSALVNQQVAAKEKLARFTRKDAEEAEKVRKQMLELGQSLEKSMTKLMIEFAPALIAVAEALTEAIRIYREWRGDKPGGVKTNSSGGMTGSDPEMNVLVERQLQEGIDQAKKRKERSRPGSRSSSGKITTAPGANAIAGSDKKLPRGLRNNNPGNIEYGPFAKRHGATGSDGRFAIFPTMEAGQAAQQALLNGYLSSGSNTIRKAISKWAPSSENNTEAYVNAVSKQMGIGADQPLSSSHIPALADAIGRHENGKAYANAMGAVDMMSRASSAGRAGISGNTSTSTTEVKVGTITVQTQATDATGIAKSIGGAVSKHGFVSQANTGLS